MNEAKSTPLGSGAMFDHIARRYDLLNRINSLGLDQSWRKKAVRALAVLPGSRVLDLATGTADLAIRMALAHPEAQIVGVDPSANMLEVGRTKVAEKGLAQRIELMLGDATKLSFADGSFDRASMAFGIRNIPDRPAALREIARVLRPGGRMVILELSTPDAGLLAPFARFHVQAIVPRVGALLSGHTEYRHLERSIACFPAPEVFGRTIEEAGFELEKIDRLTCGACALFVARKRGLS